MQERAPAARRATYRDAVRVSAASHDARSELSAAARDDDRRGVAFLLVVPERAGQVRRVHHHHASLLHLREHDRGHHLLVRSLARRFELRVAVVVLVLALHLVLPHLEPLRASSVTRDDEVEDRGMPPAPTSAASRASVTDRDVPGESATAASSRPAVICARSAGSDAWSVLTTRATRRSPRRRAREPRRTRRSREKSRANAGDRVEPSERSGRELLRREAASRLQGAARDMADREPDRAEERQDVSDEDVGCHDPQLPSNACGRRPCRAYVAVDRRLHLRRSPPRLARAAMAADGSMMRRPGTRAACDANPLTPLSPSSRALLRRWLVGCSVFSLTSARA